MVSDTVTEPAVLLGRLADGLAGGLPLAAALHLLVHALDLRSAVLRRTGDPAAPLLAVAGDVVHAVPSMRSGAAVPLRPEAPLDLPVPGGEAAALLTVVGARPAHLPVLQAAAAVLGLALRAPAPGADAAALLLDAEDDADALADALHDGPVQALVVARYACDAAVRGGDPALARDAVQDAVVALRRTLWHLRPRAAAGLDEALDALSGRLVEAGGPPLLRTLDADAAARLEPAPRSLAYRLVQSVARDADGPVRVAVRPSVDSPGHAHLDVDGGSALADPDRWQRRARALGGDLTTSPGRLRLQLPVPAPHRPAGRPAPSGDDDTKACS